MKNQPNKGGRPTLYSIDMLNKTQSYIDSCNDIEEDKENKISKKVNLPTVEGLAYELKVNKTTIYEWEKANPEYSNVIDELRSKQARSLVNNGLSGNYNSVIAKVLLTKHGYREGIDATTNDKDLIDPATVALSQSVLTKYLNGTTGNTTGE